MKKKFFPFLLIFITVLICIANYEPGTYLSGWDTIHPEFNFSEYFSRTLSVWQEHQGLGAVAAQAHASELPRLLIYFVFSLIFPDSFLRYLYFFITLILGPLGVYFFVKELLKGKLTELGNSTISFLGGLYYLLNLVTLQHFTVPLEMFVTHYATLGWLFFLSTKYLLQKRLKTLIFFSIAIIFSSPMAHTPTLFYVFFGLFSIYLFTLKFFSKIPLKRVLTIALVTLTLNLYWILPNIYYVINYGDSVILSKIHSQFSNQAIQTGKNFGNPKDSALLKNFLFDWGEYDVNKKTFVYLLQNWNGHLQNPGILFISLSLFSLILAGVALGIRKREPIIISLIPVFLISYFFITNNNVVYGLFDSIVLKKITILNEVLRFPFTKFSILLLFSYSVFFAYALASIAKLVRLKMFPYIFLFIFTPLMILHAFPFFTGNLINPIMRTKIPDEYFQVFDFFKKEDKSERIAPLPLNTFRAWSYYSWDYEGAGFTWFGIKQPLLDREFDRWMPYNENFYWETQQAIYSKNLKAFENILDKYQISWLILDKNIIDPASSKILFFDEIEQMLFNSLNITFIKQYGNIKIYKVNNPTKSIAFIGVLENLPNISPNFKWQNYDKAFVDYGTYIASNNPKPDIYYPFRSLFSNHLNSDSQYLIEETPDSIVFKKELPFDTKDYRVDKLDLTSRSTLPWIEPDYLSGSGVIFPKVSLLDSILTVSIPKLKSYFSQTLIPAREPEKEALDCDFLRHSRSDKKVGSVSNEIIKDKGVALLRLKSTLANNCGNEYILPNLPYYFGYLVSIKSRNIQNMSLLFKLENLSTKRSEIEVFLPKTEAVNTSYFIITPTSGDGSGYVLHFENLSYNKETTINDLGEISVYPIPYEFLTSIILEKEDGFLSKKESINIPIVTHPSSSFYNIDLKANKDDTLTLFQSFDKGWHAYKIEGFKILPLGNHVLVNSWANGWVLGENFSGKVWVIFLPQFLQLIGFGAVAVVFFLLLFII